MVWHTGWSYVSVHLMITVQKTRKNIFKKFQSIRNADRAVLNTVFEDTVRRVNKCLETGGGHLNITGNFLYCNHRVHRDFLITLYMTKTDQKRRNLSLWINTTHVTVYNFSLHTLYIRPWNAKYVAVFVTFNANKQPCLQFSISKAKPHRIGRCQKNSGSPWQKKKAHSVEKRNVSIWDVKQTLESCARRYPKHSGLVPPSIQQLW
jgi:hypothetical protein